MKKRSGKPIPETPVKETKDDVKLKILAASKKLFARQGYEGTTVRQICDEAGVALALVSYHFGGKENVFYALFDTLAPEFLQKEYDLTRPEDSLRALIQEFTEFRFAEPELIVIIHQEVMMQSPRLERVQSLIYKLWHQLGLIIEQGKQHGVFTYDSLKHTVHFLVGTLVYARISSFIDPALSGNGEAGVQAEGGERLEDVVRYTTDFIMNALRCRT